MVARSISVPIARSISRGVNELIGGYDPFSLFAAGEQGVWYDPSDMSTLFQDAAGTIPVTAAGQPVGLMKDKSGRGNHATQATATSRPILQFNNGLWSLVFDGVDDGGVTANIDFTATDKMTVWAGLHKLSDAAIGVIVETSTSAPTTPRAFSISGPTAVSGNNFAFRSNGSIVAATAAITGPTFASPIAAVLTGQSDIAADVMTLRVNSMQSATSSADQGTGTYGNLPLFIGRRGGTGAPFNGRLYGLIVRGVKSDDATVTQTETWMNSKTGAY